MFRQKQWNQLNKPVPVNPFMYYVVPLGFIHQSQLSILHLQYSTEKYSQSLTNCKDLKIMDLLSWVDCRPWQWKGPTKKVGKLKQNRFFSWKFLGRIFFLLLILDLIQLQSNFAPLTVDPNLIRINTTIPFGEWQLFPYVTISTVIIHILKN